MGLTKSNQVVNQLNQALKDSDEDVRGNAVEALGKIGTETAIAGLLKALKDSYFSVRWKAAEALGKIGSEAAMTELIKCLKNPDFVTLNNGDTLSQAREALDIIQNKSNNVTCRIWNQNCIFKRSVWNRLNIISNKKNGRSCLD